MPAEAWAYHKAGYRWVESKLGNLQEDSDGIGGDGTE
jgi:hypothetical protein